MPCRLQILHSPGKTNYAADAASRSPSASGSPDGSERSDQDRAEIALTAAIRHEARNTASLTWPLIADETAKDASYRRLLDMFESGNWTDRTKDADAAQFRQISDSLYVEDGVKSKRQKKKKTRGTKRQGGNNAKKI